MSARNLRKSFIVVIAMEKWLHLASLKDYLDMFLLKEKYIAIILEIFPLTIHF